MWKKGLIFILMLSIIYTANADTGGYIVGPAPSQEELDKLGDAADTSGADRTLTFWEFPLSFKINYILGYLFVFISFLKMFPIILGQIRNLNKHKKKTKIINYVLNTPGCTPSEISKDLNISRGDVRYQLKVLKAENKLSLMKEGKFTRVFQNNSVFTNNDKIIVAHLKGDTRKQILLNILEKPEITNKELSEKLNLDKSTIYWHIKKLKEDNLIFLEAEGKSKKYFVSPGVEQELLKWLKA